MKKVWFAAFILLVGIGNWSLWFATPDHGPDQVGSKATREQSTPAKDADPTVGSSSRSSSGRSPEPLITEELDEGIMPDWLAKLPKDKQHALLTRLREIGAIQMPLNEASQE